MPQLASLGWFFISIFFIFFLVLFCVSFWWFSLSPLVQSYSEDSFFYFNNWNW